MAPPKYQVAVEVFGKVKDASEVEKVLRVNREAEIVQPAAGEVLIRIRMRTINPADGAALHQPPRAKCVCPIQTGNLRLQRFTNGNTLTLSWCPAVFNVTGQSRHANANSREVFNPGNEGENLLLLRKGDALVYNHTYLCIFRLAGGPEE